MEINISKKSVMAVKNQLSDLSLAEQKAWIPILRADERKGIQALAEQIERRVQKVAMEEERLAHMWQIERALQADGYCRIAGTDEAGRGPLAGPVVAAAVILPDNLFLPGLNDSKKINASKREALAARIRAAALSYAIGKASEDEIDRFNILHAAELAMNRALTALGDFSIVLVDGTNRVDGKYRQKNVIGGDAKSASIAAASILAKVHRDALMLKLDQSYPQYGFAQHKGYGTADHYAAIRRYGPSPCHRKSFKLFQ